MTSRAQTFRGFQLRKNTEKENIIGLKEVKKPEVTEIVGRRPALKNIANKANIGRSNTVSGPGDVPSKGFKKPVVKKPLVKKDVQKKAVERVVSVPVRTTEPISEVSMASVSQLPEDMSIVETKPQAEAPLRTNLNPQPNVELQPSPEAENVPDTDVENLSEAFSSQLLDDIEDIDEFDEDNPTLLPQYVNFIYEYMRDLETKHLVRPNYLKGGTVTPKMRTILVDWLTQVHNRFSLMSETLYLTIMIVDRFLQIEPNTSKDKLQLVGVAAMFCAGKYEEMYCPEISDYVYITDQAYTKFQIRGMEMRILKALNFHISYPLPLHFLRRNSKAAHVDARVHMMAKYLMELSLVDSACVHLKASQLGAAALNLSMQLLEPKLEWTDTATYYSGYSEREIMPHVVLLANMVLRSHDSKQKSVPLKYTSSKLMRISEIPELRGEVIKKIAGTVC